MIKKTLTVRTLEQAAAWLELDGQISDGYWENAQPSRHFEPWCNAVVAVAEPGQPCGRNFKAIKDNYNFVAQDLLDVVGLRMLGIVRIARAHGLKAAAALEFAVSCEGTLYEDHGKELELAGITREQAAAALACDDYDVGDLRADLRELKKIVRMWTPAASEGGIL